MYLHGDIRFGKGLQLCFSLGVSSFALRETKREVQNPLKNSGTEKSATEKNLN